VGAEAVLTPALLLAGGSILAASNAPAERALREPVRLTAGATNQLMGVLSPDESALYFVSDAQATLDLTVQRPVNAGPVTLSSGLGDVAWPQVSPDGKRIAYVCYERDATGDVCVRDLTGGKETRLTGLESAELQVLWWDASSLAVLSRGDLHGDFSLRRLPISGGDETTVIRRNMVGVALSPSRTWIAYIPLEKSRAEVGVTFANRVGNGIHLVRPGASSQPFVYTPQLPGVMGYLAFSPDQKFLYFAQYLNDTNRDGAINGDDNGVILRVPFHAGRARPVGDAEPQQLTSARWDCHYPSPGKTTLILTCSHRDSLDIYALPLSGAVPAGWSPERIHAEIAVARDYWAQLLLYARLLALDVAAGERTNVLRQMMALHVSLREYESALYYSEQLDQRGVAASEWARMMAELTRHRRAELALVRGQPSQRYIAAETARAADLALLQPQVTGDALVLVKLVLSEIQDDIGDKTTALDSFSAIDIARVDDPLLLPLIADRAAGLHALRADRASLVAVYRALATHQALDTAGRLRYARAFVSEVSRGVPRDQRGRALSDWRDQVDAESEIALLLDVELALLGLSDETQEDKRKTLFDLYKKNRDEDRRRALVLSTVRFAADVGNEYLQYQFATSWAGSLRQQDPERKYAEQLYRDIVLDRAYGELAQGQVAEARGYFYGSTVAAESLEGHMGFIEAALIEGKQDLDAVYEQRFASQPDSPVYAFVKAYLIARTLPQERKLDDLVANAGRALVLLEAAAAALPRRAEIHQLSGYVLHQRSRRTGSRQDAVAANRQYLLALDLARDNLRIRAALWQELASVQASLGNHRKALEYYQQRARLPHVRAEGELGFRIARALSARQVGDYALAVDELERARALVDRHGELERYRPLVLDRLAMSLNGRGDGAGAGLAYRALARSLAGRSAGDPAGMPLNRIKALIGLGSAALTAHEPAVAIEALTSARKQLEERHALRIEPEVVWNRSLLHDYRYDAIQYAAVASGLLAAAHRQAGDLVGAERALRDRQASMQARYDKTGADEDLASLARIDYQLAELAYRQKRMGDARERLEAGLLRADAYDRSTGSPVSEGGLQLLRAYAELHLYGGVPLERYALDLAQRLDKAYALICAFPSPQWSDERFLFEIYLTMLAARAPAPRNEEAT
jgi:hypothetical protein